MRSAGCLRWGDVDFPFLVSAGLLIAAALGGSGASTVNVVGSRLIVDGDPSFVIKGIAYSPVPVGQDGARHGDFFVPSYSELWSRDFPLLKRLGANTLRVYHWLPNEDHQPFLDAAHASGLRVIVTYDLTSAQFMPVGTAEERQQIIGNFTEQVARYKSHPAVLMWCFGNELNGDWNGFVVCVFRQSVPHPLAPSLIRSVRQAAIGKSFNCSSADCQWQHFFAWLDDAFAAARAADADHPVTTALADMGEGFLKQMAAAVPHLSLWGLNMYACQCHRPSRRGPFRFGGTVQPHNCFQVPRQELLWRVRQHPSVLAAARRDLGVRRGRVFRLVRHNAIACLLQLDRSRAGIRVRRRPSDALRLEYRARKRADACEARKLDRWIIDGMGR